MTGRPTLYSEEMVAKARDYIDTYSESNNAIIPSVAGLALRLGVSRQTIYEWNSDPEKAVFSDILQEILSKQEEILMNGALRGDLNATIAKLALGKHGYTDKAEQTIQGGEKPVQTKHTIEFIDGTSKDA